VTEVSTPPERLTQLVREVERHKEAIRAYKLSAYPEMRARHELKLLSLYSDIWRHCQEHGLVLPLALPRE